MTKNNRLPVPPNPPWKPLAICEASGGCVGSFLNDDLSGLPVRAITVVGDNKADPNLETKTYGLFSTCHKVMRKSIVKHGRRHVFFITNRRGVPVLAGLYLVKWYAPVSSDDNDFCLAADSIWFVQDPIPLVDVDRVCGTNVARVSRAFKNIDAEKCRKMERLLKRRANATGSYLSEIDRLERFNLKHGGYRYVTFERRDSYSWDCDKVMTILDNAIRQTQVNT